MLHAVLFLACLASPGGTQQLTAQPFAREVPVSLAPGEAWSWSGLPQGPQEACGVRYELPAPGVEGEPATASTVTLRESSAVVYAVVSPVVELHLASVGFRYGTGIATVGAQDWALAWAAPEPSRRRLLLARAEAPEGQGLTQVVPRGCYVFAVLVGDRAAATDAQLRSAYADGQRRWQEQFLAEVSPFWRLRRTVEHVPTGRIAILPPTGGESAGLSLVLSRTGLDRKLVKLTGEDLLDPARFSAQRFPLALCAGLEQHLRTIHRPNDAAEAVVRYLAEGGAIVMAIGWPFPTYYAVDADAPAPIPNQPLLRRLGIECTAAFEQPPPGSHLLVRPAEGQALLPGLPGSWPYPTSGDLRLRCFTPLPGQATRMTPLLEVRDEQGRLVGPCGALFELAGPGHPAGTILYVWSGVMNDTRVSETVACDLVRWMAARLEGVADAP